MAENLPHDEEFLAKLALTKLWMLILHSTGSGFTKATISEIRSSILSVQRGLAERDQYKLRIEGVCSSMLAPGWLENLTEEGTFDLLLRISELRELLQSPR